MITRVTSQTMLASSSRNLQNSIAALQRTQDKASSQKAISRPSDDPAATADAMAIRVSQSTNGQYSRNINDAKGWLTTSDSALTQVSDLLRRARDLTVRGANDGAMSPTAKEAIATELETIRDQLLGVANTEYLGRTIFAGSSDAGAAFADDFSFLGSPTGTVQRRIGEGATVRVDVDGQDVFGSGTNSIFSDLNTIVDNLRTGVNVRSGIGVIDDRMQNVLGALSSVGAAQNATASAESNAASSKVLLETKRSAIEDVDTAQVFLELQMKSNVYQAALLVTSKTLQTSLMDFLR